MHSRPILLILMTVAACAFAEGDGDGAAGAAFDKCAQPEIKEAELSAAAGSNPACAEAIRKAYKCCAEPRADGCDYSVLDSQNKFSFRPKPARDRRARPRANLKN